MATLSNKHQPTPTTITPTTTTIRTTTATTSLVTPPPDLHLETVDRSGRDGGGCCGSGNDEYEDLHKDSGDDIFLSDQGAGSRRPSTASLSRFRSCPQLASVMNASQDSPGCDMAPMTDADGNMLHTIPVVSNTDKSSNSNTLQVERPRFEMTSTPTPPSTPGSRRKEIGVSSSYCRTQSQSNGVSPSSTPKLSRRSMADQNQFPRTVSSDSQGVDCAIPSRGLTCENLMKLDDLSLRDTVSKRRSFYDDLSQEEDRASDALDASSMHLCGRHSQQHHLQHPDHHLSHHSSYHNPQQQLLYPGGEDDSVDKCNRWLQGLKLSKSDKIKSRSHIQLPAI